MNLIEQELKRLESQEKETRAFLRNHRKIRIQRDSGAKAPRLLFVTEENGKLRRERVNLYDKRVRSFLAYKVFEIRERRLQRNIENVRKCRKAYEDASYERIFNELRGKYNIQDKEYLPQIMKDFTRAGKTPYRIIKGEEDDFKQEGKIHISSTGKGYRSKSELMIDEQLRKYNVLFDYECKLFCGGKTYRPDFVITRNDGSTVIWEHFGLVGDPEYIEKMLAKYSDYIHSGIAPWDNLIMTFDHKDGGLDMEEVDFIINSRIIR